MLHVVRKETLLLLWVSSVVDVADAFAPVAPVTVVLFVASSPLSTPFSSC